jgi:hypothetical protein
MDLLRRAQALGLKGERAFWRRVHELRAGHRPADWTASPVVALDAALTASEKARRAPSSASSKSTPAARPPGRGSI